MSDAPTSSTGAGAGAGAGSSSGSSTAQARTPQPQPHSQSPSRSHSYSNSSSSKASVRPTLATQGSANNLGAKLDGLLRGAAMMSLAASASSPSSSEQPSHHMGEEDELDGSAGRGGTVPGGMDWFEDVNTDSEESSSSFDEGDVEQAHEGEGAGTGGSTEREAERRTGEKARKRLSEERRLSAQKVHQQAADRVQGDAGAAGGDGDGDGGGDDGGAGGKEQQQRTALAAAALPSDKDEGGTREDRAKGKPFNPAGAGVGAGAEGGSSSSSESGKEDQGDDKEEKKDKKKDKKEEDEEEEESKPPQPKGPAYVPLPSEIMGGQQQRITNVQVEEMFKRASIPRGDAQALERTASSSSSSSASKDTSEATKGGPWSSEGELNVSTSGDGSASASVQERKSEMLRNEWLRLTRSHAKYCVDEPAHRPGLTAHNSDASASSVSTLGSTTVGSTQHQHQQQHHQKQGRSDSSSAKSPHGHAHAHAHGHPTRGLSMLEEDEEMAEHLDQLAFEGVEQQTAEAAGAPLSQTITATSSSSASSSSASTSSGRSRRARARRSDSGATVGAGASREAEDGGESTDDTEHEEDGSEFDAQKSPEGQGEGDKTTAKFWSRMLRRDSGGSLRSSLHLRSRAGSAATATATGERSGSNGSAGTEEGVSAFRVNGFKRASELDGLGSADSPVSAGAAAAGDQDETETVVPDSEGVVSHVATGVPAKVKLQTLVEEFGELKFDEEIIKEIGKEEYVSLVLGADPTCLSLLLG